MITRATPTRHSRTYRIGNIFVAIALGGYAISDDQMYGGAPGFGATQAAIMGVACGLLAVSFSSSVWSARAFFMAVSGLAALLVGEFVAEPLLGPIHRSCYELDDRVIFKLRSNWQAVYFRTPDNGGQRISYRINSDGFRGEEFASRPGGLRLMVYGDSFVHAYYCPDSETIPVQLGLRLNAKLSSPAEVINGGVSSYGPDQISLKMETDLPKYSPDLIILAVYSGNDYGDLIRNKVFRLNNSGQLVRNTYALSPYIRNGFELNTRESVLKRASRKLISGIFDKKNAYSQMGALPGGLDRDTELVDHWLQKVESEYDDYILQGNNVVTNPYQDYYDADVSVSPNGDSARYKVRLMDAVLSRCKTVADDNGIPIVFLFIPHALSVCENYSTGRVDRERYPDYRRENLTKPLEDWALANNAHYVNLFNVYREQAAESLYFRGKNDHWNRKGQEIAADATMKYLAKNGMLSEFLK